MVQANALSGSDSGSIVGIGLIGLTNNEVTLPFLTRATVVVTLTLYSSSDGHVALPQCISHSLTRFKRVTVDGCSLLHLDTKSEPCGLALVSFRERPVSNRTVIQAPAKPPHTHPHTQNPDTDVWLLAPMRVTPLDLACPLLTMGCTDCSTPINVRHTVHLQPRHLLLRRLPCSCESRGMLSPWTVL